MDTNKGPTFSMYGVYELDENLDEGYEAVWTVDEYYNGPIWGVADYKGTPHIYRMIAEYKDKDEWGYVYGLSPISEIPAHLVSEEQLKVAESSTIKAKGHLRWTHKFMSGYAMRWERI